MAYSSPTDFHSERSVEFYSRIARSVIHHADSWVQDQNGKDALDLGSGTGISTLAFSSHWKDYRWTACDASIPMLEFSRSHLPTTIGLANATVSPSGETSLPFLDSSFDLITSNFSLHWMLGKTTNTNPSIFSEIRLGINPRRLQKVNQYFTEYGLPQAGPPERRQYVEHFPNTHDWLNTLKFRGSLEAISIPDFSVSLGQNTEEHWDWWCIAQKSTKNSNNIK